MLWPELSITKALKYLRSSSFVYKKEQQTQGAQQASCIYVVFIVTSTLIYRYPTIQIEHIQFIETMTGLHILGWLIETIAPEYYKIIQNRKCVA